MALLSNPFDMPTRSLFPPHFPPSLRLLPLSPAPRGGGGGGKEKGKEAALATATAPATRKFVQWKARETARRLPLLRAQSHSSSEAAARLQLLPSPRSLLREQTKRKWEERLKDIEELASSYKRRPLCPRYKPQLSKPWQATPVWKLFHRQTQAFNFAKTCKQDVHVFALEKNTENKQRIYLVTTYTELWFYYRTYNETSLMHCYEVIPEEAVCKLYFDLEFYIPANQEADGKQMVADLIEFICKKIDEHYGIKCSVEDVLNLDSSTKEKFSCHLIFLLHNAAFKNNMHIGNFLRKILQPAVLLTRKRDAMVPEKQVVSHSQSCKAATDLPSSVENQTVTKDVSHSRQLSAINSLGNGASQWKENLDLSFLIVNGKHGEKQLFVDLGVYTKNRNFRLYKSSKAGNSVVLDIAEDNRFVPEPVKNSCIEEQYFLSSLICNVRFSDSLKILSCENPKETKEKSTDLDGSVSNGCLDPIGGYQCSPYPEIDNFVLFLVNKDNVQGGIRKWNYFSLEQLLVYDISKYRWCMNIGRAHKSNNIMYVYFGIFLKIICSIG
nr:DNA-directed primase/polymerase protein [Zootoca vivipara]